ncbi:MAG: molecular chaperone DnaJ [Clostridiales bacterium]|jgi:molecular chaperone DnaJ|nr:molecular chaperone DnaJ [Clostridiales bacterium]
MAKQDYYEILGVPRSASEDELKKAYRAAVKKYHPDSNPGDARAEARFKEVNEAYTVLSDADKRAKYDQFGHSAGGADFGGGGFGGFGNFADFAEIFNDMGIFGGRRRGRRGPAPGSDVEITLQIDFADAIFGVERELEFSIKDNCDGCRGTGAKQGTTPESCKVCSGSGQTRQTVQTPLGYMETASTCRACRGSGKVVKEPCTICHGSGKENKRKKIVVSVPKGIGNGQSIKYGGAGEAGEVGAPKGDLYVRILVASHPSYVRRGNDIYAEKQISFSQAALGGEIAIETPYGEEYHKLSPGTQPDAIITLRGKGMPYINSSNKSGDMVVVLKLVVPKNLTDTQKDLLRQFAAEGGEQIEDAKKGFFNKFKK